VTVIDSIDRQIIAATQSGLPLTPTPYHALAEEIGVPDDELISRLKRLAEGGAIRRIGAIPNHYALGLTANGMSVWDVDDEVIAEIGAEIGALEFVTHCYERPRHIPLWPYNLFAMVHGSTRDEVRRKVTEIRLLIGPALRSHDVLFSTRILKKTGLRIS
jgi:DNA-binding Lrp family transcriptional regulator